MKRNTKDLLGAIAVGLIPAIIAFAILTFVYGCSDAISPNASDRPALLSGRWESDSNIDEITWVMDGGLFYLTPPARAGGDPMRLDYTFREDDALHILARYPGDDIDMYGFDLNHTHSEIYSGRTYSVSSSWPSHSITLHLISP